MTLDDTVTHFCENLCELKGKVRVAEVPQVRYDNSSAQRDSHGSIAVVRTSFHHVQEFISKSPAT